MIIFAESTNTNKNIWEFRNENLREKVLVDHSSAGPIFVFQSIARQMLEASTLGSISWLEHKYWATQVGANAHIALNSEEEARKAFDKICAIQRGDYIVKIGKEEKKEQAQEDI